MKTSAVLFCGDANIDIILSGVSGELVLDREILAGGYEVCLGSSAAIAAAAHARLGAKTLFGGLCGQDLNGELVRGELLKAGVEPRYLETRSDQTTGVTVNLVQPGGRYQITFPGAIPYFVPDLNALLADPEISHVHFAGIFLQEKLLSRLAEVMYTLNARGISTSVDPQWDPAGRWPGLDSWIPHADLLFCNEEEACALTGLPNSEKALERLASVCPTVVLKRGAQGATVKTPVGQWSQPGIQVAFQDAIGAGDNFAAAWLFATLSASMAPADALEFANAAAARSCEFAGGTGAQSTRGDVDQFREKHR